MMFIMKDNNIHGTFLETDWLREVRILVFWSSPSTPRLMSNKNK